MNLIGLEQKDLFSMKFTIDKDENTLYITRYDGTDDQAEYVANYVNRVAEEYDDIPKNNRATYEYSDNIEGSIVYLYSIPDVIYQDYTIYPGDYIVENYDGLIYVVPAGLEQLIDDSRFK